MISRMPLKNSIMVIGARNINNKKVQEKIANGWIFICSEKRFITHLNAFKWVVWMERDY